MTYLTTTGIGPLDYGGPARPSWPARRILTWAVGTIVIGGMLISVLLPSLCRGRETANRVKCASNMRQIGQAIVLFAQRHGGQYPASLAALLAEKDITSSVMVCPSSNDLASTASDTAGVVADLTAAESNTPGHAECLSYIYTGRGLTTSTASETTIVLYEPLNNHDGRGTNALFGDGHVEFVSQQSWPSVARAGGVTLASSLTTLR